MTQIERVVVKPPAALLTCPDEPTIPDDLTHQDVVSEIIPDLVDAGSACRSRVKALKRFFEEVTE